MARGKTIFYKQGHFWGLVGVPLTLSSLGVGADFSGHTAVAHICFTLAYLFALMPAWITCDHYEVGRWRYVFFLLLAGIFFGIDQSLLPSAATSPKAKIVILGVKPVPVPEDNTWPHVNVAYQNVGSMPAHSICARISVTVVPNKWTDAVIEQNQTDISTWTSSEWLAKLRSKKNEELADGAPGAMFSFPDHPDKEITDAFGVTLPRVLTDHWYAYVIVTFKFWDDSMPKHTFGVKETCVFFVNNLDLNNVCGRNRTFLAREAFTHEDIR